jgi:Ser/Thr protein kinase RdoA (MazF antagonist)
MSTDVPTLAVSPPRRVPRPGQLLHEIRSRQRPPPIGGTTVRTVLNHYGEDAGGPLAALPVGWRSDNVVVTTATGTLVIKRYPARAAGETILHEHSIARRAAKGDIPVAPLRTSLGGDTFCAVDDRYFAVADLVEGVSFTGCYLSAARASQLSHDAGRLLASFHDELEGFRPLGRHHLGLGASKRLPGAGTDACLRSLEGLRRLGVGESRSVTERWLAERSAMIADAIVELNHRLSQRDLAVGIIHGDFGLHNLTYARDGEATIHDLELARLDPLLIDVVIVLSRSSPRRGRAFLEGYRSVRELGSADWNALPDLWQHYRLCGAVRSWQNFRDQGGERRLAAARQRVEEAERVAREGVGAWE